MGGLLKLEEAAAYLRVAKNRVTVETIAGRLAVIVVGNAYRWTTEDLDDWIERNRRPAAV
jgi:excisionase family DNA binding protein